VLPNKSTELKFSKIILIGGGELLLYTAILLKKNRINFSILVSKRHSEEKFGNISFTDFLKIKNINYKIVKNINLNINSINAIKPNSLALCFGPSWIFSKKILKLFNYNMFNINLVPLPKYMGGAHFTWQILNNNFNGGVYFQKITDKLDQGPILLGKKFTVKRINNVDPSHFFKENMRYGKKFIDSLIIKIKNNFKFQMKDFKKKYSSREYFPRLLTKKNGFINWNWKMTDIVKFCNAFDSPYPGAQTYHKNKIINLRSVSIYKKKKFHPFVNGLIIRKNKNNIYVALADGVIKIIHLINQNKIYNNKVCQGDRFYVPNKIIENSLRFRKKFK
jgi:methionyl-tRNA formyltransferase